MIIQMEGFIFIDMYPTKIDFFFINSNLSFDDSLNR